MLLCSIDQSHDSERVQLIEQGSTRLEIDYSQALQQTINIAGHAEFQNLLRVDRHRSSQVDLPTGDGHGKYKARWLWTLTLHLLCRCKKTL